MKSRGFTWSLSDRTRRGMTLSWLVLFVLSILLQFGSVVAPSTAFALVSDGGTYSVEVADNTTSASATTSGGALLDYIGDQDLSFGSAGTGTFDSFLRVQASPNERGYNTDGEPEFDTKGGIWTHAILVSEIPVMNIGGVNYWELFADVNDGNNDPQISLNDLEVWFTSDPELVGYDSGTPGTFGGNATKKYDFSGVIKINDVNQGSGRGDLRYQVPTVGMDIPANCSYGSTTCTTYFVLYTQWGLTSSYNSDGGFEEWKVKQYPTPALAIDKGVSLTNGSGYGPSVTTTVGTTVYYRIHVSNTGNVALTGVTLTDSLFDLVAKGCTIPTSLAVGASFDCDYSDTAAVGTRTNTATADSTETAPVSDSASVTVQVIPPPPPPPPTPSPTPTQTVLAETATPTITLPPTDTNGSDQAPSGPGFGLMLALLAIAGIGLLAGYLVPTPGRLRREEVRRR
ncbi:MAG TPA: hypothetical protein VLS28_01825 [Candidatus Sulfomarinibacteraceae bacterium]|nr:hypothetical protein [Candidatus Sulfomarinibacteraceae bacterium]